MDDFQGVETPQKSKSPEKPKNPPPPPRKQNKDESKTGKSERLARLIGIEKLTFYWFGMDKRLQILGEFPENVSICSIYFDEWWTFLYGQKVLLIIEKCG